MELKGYIGKILQVDLSRSRGHIEDLREEWVCRFIGGSGLGAKFLYEMTDKKIGWGYYCKACYPAMMVVVAVCNLLLFLFYI